MRPSFALHRIPFEGIGFVIALTLVALALVAGAISSLHRTEQLEQRVRGSDSTAVVKTLEAVIWHRDAVAARVRADEAERRADSLAQLAGAARADVVTKVARASASRALVDTVGLRPDVAQALADADTLRLAVTPALAADARVIAAQDGTIALLRGTIALGDSAFAAQSDALRARLDQVHALEQLHAPRCGWRCGAVVGASAAVVTLGGAVYLLALLSGG